MKRRDFLGHTGVASLTLGLAGSTSAADSAQPSADETRLAANVDVVEKSFTELAAACAAGFASSASLTLAYLARIESLDRKGPTLRSVIATNPNALAIRTIVNGEVRQSSNTRDMIFDVPTLIEFLSGSTTLLPGTVILTGTPSGVGMAKDPPVWLQPGDSVTVEIEKIGTLTNPVERE